MANQDTVSMYPIGVVASGLRNRQNAPRQPFHDAPEASLIINQRFIEAIDGIKPGAEILVLTWLHNANRDILKVYPGHDPRNALAGVFSTRSPDRPNPIGLHRVKVLAIEDHGRLKVDHMEAIDGTPILDIKPVLNDWRGQ